MATHSRRKKPIPDPATGKNRYIHGVGFHKASNQYRIQWTEDGKARSEYFLRTVDGLRRAIERRAAIDAKPTVFMRESPETARDRLLDLGIPEEILDANPSIVEAEQRDRINPEWWQDIPTSKRPEAMLRHVFRRSPVERLGETENSDGRRLTVRQVGELYREWYVSERCDIQDLRRHAHNDNTKPDTRKPSKRKAHPRRNRIWIQYAPRRVRLSWSEHKQVYSEFEKFCGADTTIDLVTGDLLRDFSRHVKIQATRKASPRSKRPLTNPDLWINKRFDAVQKAFRRVRKEYSSAAWAKGLFGIDGNLAILEKRNTAPVGSQVQVTPAEFRAMLLVADVQWNALLKLALNCALKNSDMRIPWSAIDFDRCIMNYPRPKNKRPRKTPLAPETIIALGKWRKHSPNTATDQPIFRTSHGNPWIGSTDSIAKHWDHLRKKVKEQTGDWIEATFQSLRKSGGPTIIKAKVENAELAIQFLLGHAPAKAWRHYVGIQPQFLEDAVEAIRCRYLLKPGPYDTPLGRRRSDSKRKGRESELD